MDELEPDFDPTAGATGQSTNYRDWSAERARELDPGSLHYRAYVGSPREYDRIGASQFAIMVSLGLREHHSLLDIGCGSLSAGRLFIPYLLPGRYFGLEPKQWLIDDGIKNEVTEQQWLLKRARLLISDNFDCEHFKTNFDFVLAQSVLTHVSKSQIQRCFSQVQATLQPNGLFAASFYWNGSTYEGDDWIYPEFSSFPVTFIVDMAAECGLRAYPLIWSKTYSHYWLAFSRADRTEAVPWLSTKPEEARFFKILELRRELDSAQQQVESLKRQLEGVRRPPQLESRRE